MCDQKAIFKTTVMNNTSASGLKSLNRTCTSTLYALERTFLTSLNFPPLTGGSAVSGRMGYARLQLNVYVVS